MWVKTGRFRRPLAKLRGDSIAARHGFVVLRLIEAFGVRFSLFDLSGFGTWFDCNKKLLVTSASLLVTSALLLGARSY